MQRHGATTQSQRGFRPCVALTAVALGLALTAPVAANPVVSMPEYHAGAVIHLDTGVRNLAAAPGPGNMWSTFFTDGLNAPAQPWHWETELHNPRSTSISGTAGWYWPKMGISKAVQVTLAPGASLYAHMCFAENPEAGGHQYTMANYDTTGPVDMHATIQECTEWEDDYMVIEGEGDVIDLTGTDPLTCDFQHLPEPATLGLLALGGLALLRRRRDG